MGNTDYVAHIETQTVDGKTRKTFKELGNIADMAIKMALEEAKLLEGQGGVVQLYATGKWAATFGPGGWVNTVRPPFEEMKSRRAGR